ncbi:MAG: ROK family protein [Fusicatenibacter sp.]
MRKKYICLDVGGTYLKYGILLKSGEILKKGKVRTASEEGGTAVFEQVVHLIQKQLESTRADGICISTTGMVDPVSGKILYSSDAIPGYAGIVYKPFLEQKFGIPCQIENDVNCAGLAESISGAGKDSRINLCLTVGTGIGGCLVVDKKIYHGSSNSACEVGYMKIPQGEFQKEASASALCEKVTGRKRQIGAAEDAWDGIRIFEAAKRGDPICMQALEELADTLALGIANICYVVNPQTVILGGGIMEQEAYMKPRIERALDRYLVPQILQNTAIRMAEHQNDAGLLGALYHFLSAEREEKKRKRRRE